jgi:hypothetical protein
MWHLRHFFYAVDYSAKAVVVQCIFIYNVIKFVVSIVIKNCFVTWVTHVFKWHSIFNIWNQEFIIFVCVSVPLIMVGFTAHHFQSSSIPLSHFYYTLSSPLLLTAMKRAFSLGNRWLIQMCEVRKLWEHGDANCCHVFYTRRDPLSLWQAISDEDMGM